MRVNPGLALPKMFVPFLPGPSMNSSLPQMCISSTKEGRALVQPAEAELPREKDGRSPVITSIHLARALTYAPLLFTVEFNCSERSILNVAVLLFPKPQFCRQVKPAGHAMGEVTSPPSQVPWEEVGLLVVGLLVEVGLLVVGLLVEDGLLVVGLLVDVGLLVVGVAEGALVGTDVGIPEAALDGLAVVGNVVAVTDGTAVGIAESALVGRAIVGLEVGVALGLYVLGVVVGVCVVGVVMGVDVVGLAVGRFVVGVMGRSVGLDVVIDTMVFVIVMFVVSV